MEIYYKGKRFIAKNLRHVDKILTRLWGPKFTDEELTNIRFELIVKMLEADGKLRKRVKGFILTYC